MAKSLFNDFSVTFHGSEVELCDFDGNPYPDDGYGTILPSEKAYEFLSQLNAADKEWFDQRLLGMKEPQRVYFDITLPENEPILGICFQLGKLEFRNAQSVAEALSKFLPHVYDQILQYPNEFDDQALTKEECVELKGELKIGLAILSNEESLFLSLHPDIRQLNEQSIHGAYLYAIPRDDFKELRQKKPRTILRALDKPQDEALSIVLPKELQPPPQHKIQRINYLEPVDFSTIEQSPIFLLPDEDMALFESSLDTAEMAAESTYHLDQHLHIHAVISEREISALHQLNQSFSLKEMVAPFDSREEDLATMKWDTPPKVFRGFDAFEHFLRNHVGIFLGKERDSKTPKPFLPAIRAFKDVELRFQDTPFFHLQYKDLPRKVYQELGGICTPKLPPEAEKLLKRAWSVRAKYDETHTFNPWLEALPSIKVPTCKESRKMLEDSYAPPPTLRSLEDRIKANLFYDAHAACDIGNDTPEKLCRSTLIHMALDGFPKSAVKSILRSGSPHPAYYLSLANRLLSKDPVVQEAFQNIRLQEPIAK